MIKIDGDICGGVVFLVCEIIGKLIKFIGIGEKIIDIEIFYFDCMVSCILGMGDLLIFIECVS